MYPFITRFSHDELLKFHLPWYQLHCRTTTINTQHRKSLGATVVFFFYHRWLLLSLRYIGIPNVYRRVAGFFSSFFFVAVSTKRREWNSLCFNVGEDKDKDARTVYISKVVTLTRLIGWLTFQDAYNCMCEFILRILNYCIYLFSMDTADFICLGHVIRTDRWLYKWIRCDISRWER